jgi:hypothetical protein
VGIASIGPWWGVAIVVGLPVAGKVVITIWSLRGTKPADRPRIIQAVADLFPITAWSRTRRSGPSKTPEGNDRDGKAPS